MLYFNVNGENYFYIQGTYVQYETLLSFYLVIFCVQFGDDVAFSALMISCTNSYVFMGQWHALQEQIKHFLIKDKNFIFTTRSEIKCEINTAYLLRIMLMS